MTTWRVEADDRDEQGRIRLAPTPRAIDPFAHTSAPLPATADARPHTSGGPLTQRVLLAGVSAGLLVAALLITLIGRVLPATPPLRTVAPVASVVTSPVASPPVPSPAPVVPQVVAFAAPGGDVLGPVAAAQSYHFVGRYGAAWLQSDVPGSGRVWVRRADLRLDQDDLTAIAKLPDLAPPPTPVPPPPPTPVPTQCAIVGVGAASASACGTADLDTLQATAQAQLMADQHLRPVAVTTATPYGGSYATTP